LLVSSLAGGLIGICFLEIDFRPLSSLAAGGVYGFTLCLAHNFLGPFSRARFILAGACSGALAGVTYDIVRGGGLPGYLPLLIGVAFGGLLVAVDKDRIRRILEGDFRALYREEEEREPALAEGLTTAPSSGGSLPLAAPDMAEPPLGIILGISIGLLLDSILILLFRVTIIYFLVFSLGTVLIAPFFLGIRIGKGIVKAAKPRRLSLPVLGLVAILSWPAAVTLPWGVQFLWLRWTAHSKVPVPPAARTEGAKVTFGDNENTGDEVELSFTTPMEPSDIVAYYRNELVRRGWEEGQAYGPETRQDNTTYRFRQKDTVHTILLRLEDPRTGDRNTGYRVIYKP
jgi:hypothetical protein